MGNDKTFWHKTAKKYAASPIKNVDAFSANGFELKETGVFDGGAMSRFIVAKKT